MAIIRTRKKPLRTRKTSIPKESTMEVKLIMSYTRLRALGEENDKLRKKEVKPTGNWKVVCTDGECVLWIGIEGRTVASKSVEVKGWFGRMVTKQEHYYIDCEKFVPEKVLELAVTTNKDEGMQGLKMTEKRKALLNHVEVSHGH